MPQVREHGRAVMDGVWVRTDMLDSPREDLLMLRMQANPEQGHHRHQQPLANDWAKKRTHTIEYPKSCDQGSVLRSGGGGADKRKNFRPKAKQKQTRKERLTQSCFYLKAFADPRKPKAPVS